ncbi:MAG: 4-alpha-glucanotransferase [Xanthomonadaceae bacterium]|nr:4-alpha-glucanotransferase [Xanthomonadaceae bacterium]
MSDAVLYELAEAAGLLVDWVDIAGKAHRVAPTTLREVLEALDFPANNDAACSDSLRRLRECAKGTPQLCIVTVGEPVIVNGEPGAHYQLYDESGECIEGRLDTDGRVSGISAFGYYTLLCRGQDPVSIAVAPPRCYGIADRCGDGARRWGVGLQVYSAREERDAGIGDAGAVARWACRIAGAGGDILGLSPVHASRPSFGHYSPYYPSDRRFLEPLYAAPALVLGKEEADAALAEAGVSAEFEALHAAPLIDWQRSTRVKWAWLKRLHRRFEFASAHLREDYARFHQMGGERLRHYARHAAADRGDKNETAVDLQCFAQWLAARSWSEAQKQACEAGMAFGLIADLAVGFDPAGAEASAWRQAVLPGVTLGAPPDAFNPQGQTWGIGTYSPVGLIREGFAPFIQLLRAVMRDRGGVRIDHILGFLRLWTVPAGGASADGVYLRYPFRQLIQLLALESWRHRAIVIGEDLGVVPAGLRDELSHWGVLGIDVLLFARGHDGAFLSLDHWRHDAVATTTTHDLPTLVGWRKGLDMLWRARLGLGEASLKNRHADVTQLQDRVASTLGGDGTALDDWLRFVSRGPSPLALLPIEDALEIEEQPNFPGTVDQHPNWRQRLPEPISETMLTQHFSAFAESRGETEA